MQPHAPLVAPGAHLALPSLASRLCRLCGAQDIRWSPVESTVFSSCSADGTVAIWDVRKRAGSALSVKAHETDANVISWNGGVSYLLVSGADDGCFKIWDLRSFRAGSPVASFSWHKAPITSIEWCARSRAKPRLAHFLPVRPS